MSRVQASPNLSKLNVLYVEDEPEVREAFSMILRRVMKNVFVASNGLEGLETFKNEKIDFIISDIRMPKMTGLEMVEEIQKLDAQIPVLFTTAFSDSKYLLEAIDIGVNGYLIKPIDRNKLITKINLIADNLVTKAELNSYMELVKIIFEEQNELVILLNENMKVELTNKAFKNIFVTINFKEFYLKDILERMGSEDMLSSEQVREKILANEHILLSKNGSYFRPTMKKTKRHWLLFLTDVSEFEREAQNLKEASMVDELTSLYNRKKLEISKELFLNTQIGVIFFDIDNFKIINDTYGHSKGDDVLKILAQNVKHTLRETDMLIRWGGEEFIVMVKGAKNVDTVEELAEKLRKIVNAINVEGVGHFSCSFGVDFGFVDSFETLDKMIENADTALYISKKNGKNMVSVFK